MTLVNRHQAGDLPHFLDLLAVRGARVVEKGMERSNSQARCLQHLSWCGQEGYGERRVGDNGKGLGLGMNSERQRMGRRY